MSKNTLIIGLILSVIFSCAINLFVGNINKDDEFHRSVGIVSVSSHAPSEYTVTLTQDTSDDSGNIYPAGTPFYVTSLYYDLSTDSPCYSLYYVADDSSYIYVAGKKINFSYEDVNQSDDLLRDIAAKKEEALNRQNEYLAYKKSNMIYRILITILAFAAINTIAFFIARITSSKKRTVLTSLFLVLCLTVSACLLTMMPYLGHY